MTGADDHLGVVVAPETAEEAGRVATSLRAGGFHPTIDYGAIADRLGNFPVLAPLAEVAEAKGFLRGLRANQRQAAQPAGQASAEPPIRAPDWPSPLTGLLPLAGRTLAVLAGVLVLVGGVAALSSMLQFLSSLRDDH